MPSTTELLLGSLSLLLVFIGSAEAAAADGAAAAIDVTQYSRLYVKYQNCVWSPYANGCGNNQQQNNQNQQQNSYWYSAFAPCYRANVAYTVYGVKADDTGTYKTGGECNKKGNYIGSYFTTNGVEDFFDMLTQAGVGMWKSNDDNGEGGNGDNNKGDDGEVGDCQVISNNQAGDNGEGNNNNNNKQEAAQYDYTANNRKMYDETTSAGLGCSNKHKFAVKMYKGAYCDERAVLDVTDTLETLNDELEDYAQCVLIYAAAVEAVAAAEDDGADADAENEQENEEQQQQQQQQRQDEISNAGDLLVNSAACNVRLFPQTCPDPHGLLRSDARAVGQRLSSQRRSMPIVRQVFSWIFMSLGGLFIGASAWACCNKTARAEKFKRNRTNNNDDSAINKGWRTQFKRANETTVDQIKATAAAATGTAATSKRRRFFRMFSRGAKS